MTGSFRRALRHVRRLPEREALLLRAALAHHTGTYEAVAIDLLREATRRYPDEADAWFLLGESYFHGGEEVLAAPDASEKALRKAVELDPGFALPYVHLVNDAFIHRPDSARAARLIATYRRLAPNGPFGRDNRVAFDLAFGDSTHRRQAFAVLDTLPPSILAHLASAYLDHPRFWATREAVLEARPRPTTPTGRFMTALLFDNSLSRGEIRAALAQLGDARMHSAWRAAGSYAIHSRDVPGAGAALDEALALPRTDSLPADLGSTLMWFYTGAYAADHRRWEDHAAAHARLRDHAERLLAAGDSSESRFATGAALALKGQGLWRRGEARRALPLLVDGQRQALWPSSPSREALNDTIRWWLGELLLETGRPGEAALYFESLWNDPFAAERLGPIYERLGNLRAARDAYALVARAWETADPELQARAEEARAAIRRLGSVGDSPRSGLTTSSIGTSGSSAAG
jgi:tetratricopeptide (TPR) repeat protein